jgi:hypothetical protein
MMKVEVKLSGVEGILKTLRSLPPEVVSKNGGVVKKALRKGAMVIVKQAKANFRAAVALPGKTGITESTGFTEKNIVPIRKKLPPGEKGERYIVTVAYKEHPNANAYRKASRRAANSKRSAKARKIKTLRSNDIAFMMEYGTSKQEATPWLRPAFESKRQEAMDTTIKSLIVEVDKVVKKLSTQNAGAK